MLVFVCKHEALIVVDIEKDVYTLHQVYLDKTEACIVQQKYLWGYCNQSYNYD